MKKLLVVILVMIAALAIAACAPGGPAPGSAPAGTAGGAAPGSAPADQVVDAVEDVADAIEDVLDDISDAAEAAADYVAGGINSLDDLATAVIGVQRDTTGHIFADENLPGATVDAFPVAADAVMALLAGSVDAVIIDSLPAARFIIANQGRLRLLDGDLTAEYYGIAFQLGSPYTALFDDAINQLRANGTMDAIYDYWVNENPDASRYVSPPGTEHPNGVLLMGTNAGFEPFEFWEGPYIVGFDPCLAQAIGDILGYRIEIVDMDFGAIILAVQAGQVDFGMAGMTIRDDRREFVDFTQGYFNASQRVIVRA